eukprot:TRINITY_DN254_c0_g1_i1.p1 TRINITY_DN254_c0_g1~~TRINITY_DN254_c0_g1_i1.p1  ORF type:complete len:147 (+),score=44.73 TRINITY_DN254_c0_g1_i1:59-442(+)
MASAAKTYKAPAGGALICVIGDEDTVTGFLLAGIGQRDQKGQTNYLVVKEGVTTCEEVVNAFKEFTERRKDVGIVLVTQFAAEMIRDLIEDYSTPIPTVLEIPSKEHPYEERKDSVMQRVLKLLGRD